MLFDEALQYLLSLGHETTAVKLGLGNIERLLSALDHPEASYTAVQIAGTNGKGSTSVMLDAITRAARIRTGLYTSPHLSSITERIRIDGREIAPEDFARLATEVRGASERLLREGRLESPPTFFEQVTANALTAFREARIQLAILETGLGGRLDATTATRAALVGITPVAIDHQEYLGHTLAEIAGEKAAIIRSGVRAVIAPQEAEALEVIRQRARATNVVPRFAGRGIKVLDADETGRLRATFRTAHDSYEEIRLGLRGRHQIVNASVAIELAETLRELGFSISRRDIIEGLENATHAGRLELLEGSPPVLLDGAHNMAGVRALVEYLNEFISSPVTLIFGAMRDKELAEMAGLLFPEAERLILTEMKNPRAADARALSRAVPGGFDSSRVTHASSPSEALRRAFEVTPPDNLITVAGSLYLVGEIRELILKQ
jgi:dihydrofolate synthase / folylpolyglutamate synthase